MIENRDTIKRLSATAAGLGASGLLEREVGVNAGSSVVTGEDGQGSKDRSSSNSQFPPSSDLFPSVCLETQGDSRD